MVRFCANESEIAALLRFLQKRSSGLLHCVPLAAPHRDDLRYRRTLRPLETRLAADARPQAWGLLLTPGDTDLPRTPRSQRDKNGWLRVSPEREGMILLQLGAARGGHRVRQGLLEVFDRDVADPEDPHRLLVEKAARRLRRRGHREGLRWIVGEEP